MERLEGKRFFRHGPTTTPSPLVSISASVRPAAEADTLDSRPAREEGWQIDRSELHMAPRQSNTVCKQLTEVSQRCQQLVSVQPPAAIGVVPPEHLGGQRQVAAADCMWGKRDSEHGCGGGGGGSGSGGGCAKALDAAGTFLGTRAALRLLVEAPERLLAPFACQLPRAPVAAPSISSIRSERPAEV